MNNRFVKDFTVFEEGINELKRAHKGAVRALEENWVELGDVELSTAASLVLTSMGNKDAYLEISTDGVTYKEDDSFIFGWKAVLSNVEAEYSNITYSFFLILAEEKPAVRNKITNMGWVEK